MNGKDKLDINDPYYSVIRDFYEKRIDDFGLAKIPSYSAPFAKALRRLGKEANRKDSPADAKVLTCHGPQCYIYYSFSYCLPIEERGGPSCPHSCCRFYAKLGML